MSTYKFNNNEIMALLLLKTYDAVAYPNDHCVRYEMNTGSSVYVHDRPGFSFYSATGHMAIWWCESLLGRHTKLNGHGHKTWYVYDGVRGRNYRKDAA